MWYGKVINELTAGLGVTIDSVELKDGGITLASGATVNDIQTVISSSDTKIATSKAIMDYVGSGGLTYALPAIKPISHLKNQELTALVRVKVPDQDDRRIAKLA